MGPSQSTLISYGFLSNHDKVREHKELVGLETH